MKKMKNAVPVLWLFVLFLMLATAVPLLAHGEDEEGESSGVVIEEEEDDHEDDEDDHGVVENPSAATSNPTSIMNGLMPLWLGLVAGVVVTGIIGAGTKPRPSNLLLFGLALTAVTGGLHLIGGLIWSDLLLILNGIGYFALGLAWVLPLDFIPNRKLLVPIALIVYTVITIVGYFVTHDHFDALGIISKVIEVILLVVLGISLVQNKNG